MEIQDIKSKLTIAQVLHYYHLKPDKNLRLCCPFHDDKTPSMQVYYKTHTAFCFSSNCTTHGKSLDVIDFIMYKENISKHEAIEKAKQLIGHQTNKPIQELTRVAVLTKMFSYFKNGMSSCQTAQEYAKQRGLQSEKLEIGYNSGQFHHGTRREEELIKSCIKYGLLLDTNTKSRTGEAAYSPFGKWCIVFALRNKENQITGMYFRSTLNDKEQRHFYLKDRQGLYPHYPTAETKKLILTEAIIDAATLLQDEKIQEEYSILSLYGTNGLTEEHQAAIKELKQLEEIIFFFDGDESGHKAAIKYGTLLKEEYPGLKITEVNTPQGEDINSMIQSHEKEVLHHLLQERKELEILFSTEIKTNEVLNSSIIANHDNPIDPKNPSLDSNNPYNITYQGREAKYQIKGFRVEQMDSLKITIQIQSL